MRTDKKLRVKVVREDNAEDFERKLNVILENVEDPEIEWNKSMGFCAYVTYTEKEKVIEDIKDVFHNEGVHWHCRNCPYVERTTDKRKKWVCCKIKTTGMTHLDSEACDFLYRQLLSGELMTEDLIKEGGKA